MRCTGNVQAGEARGESVRARCVRQSTRSTRPLRSSLPYTMTEWSLVEHEWPAPPPSYPYDGYYPEYDPYYKKDQMDPIPPQAHQFLTPAVPVPVPVPAPYIPPTPKMDNPREIRNKAEKQRRDKMNRSIAELASIVPQVVAASRKIDKTSVLRLTAHFFRSDYVFEPPLRSDFTAASMLALLRLFKGFLLTVTYKGLIVVVSQNVNEYLGYTELELLGQNLFNIIHEDDRQILRDQLMPKSQTLGQHGELLLPDDENERCKMAQALVSEQRSFFVRFKKLGQRSEPSKYVTCHIQGSFKMSDRAFRGKKRGCQIIRRARARGDNPCSSGNDVVFIGVVRPTTDTFINESALESYKMEYRTRHSIDGEIIQCEQRIALVTGYMTSEVNGVNAMNFIHKEEVRWVIVALKEMYNKNHLFGESCYRLIMRNGQFVYMRTRGRLDVDPDTRAVTSFVCTNTVVDEREGKHLIKMMKDRYNLKVNINEETLNEDVQNTNVNPSVPVEDPRLLEKVILNLVTNLPSPEANIENSPNEHSFHQNSPSQRLALIAPKKERIVSAIEKIYTVIKTIPKQPSFHKSFTASYTQVDVTELTSYNPTQYSDTEGNNEASPTSSDVEYVPNSIYHEINPLKMAGEEENLAGVEPNLDFQTLLPGIGIPPPELFKFSGPSTAGIKRSRNQDDEVTTKKKVIDANDPNSRLKPTGKESPALETLFNDTDFNAEIESAMKLMDNIDPNLLEMLISNGVQTLEKVECDTGEIQSNINT